MAEEGPFASRHVPEDLVELRGIELAAIGRAAAPRDLTRPAAGLARLLRIEAARREKAAVSPWHRQHKGRKIPQGQHLRSSICAALRTNVRKVHSADGNALQQAPERRDRA